MAAHQLIYTSCRRGMMRTTDGLQVFSFDQGLPESPRNFGNDYQLLMPFEVPESLGVSVFGYVYSDDLGCVFNLNTRLEHDYMGPQGRSGNMLRHAVQAELDDLAFPPIELTGSPLFRTSMDFDAMNSSDQPAYLPAPQLAPAGIVSIGRVADWVEDNDCVEEVQALVAAVLNEVVAKGRKIVIIDDTDNVARWIGAVSYALPPREARKLSFATYSDDWTASPAGIVGTSRERFDACMKPYLADSCVVFDMETGSYPEYDGTSAFLNFVDTAYSFDAEAFRAFGQFCDTSMSYELSLESLDAACNAYVLARTQRLAARPSVFESGLQAISLRGTAALNSEVVDMMIGDVDTLRSLDPDTYLTALVYLLQRWAGLQAEGRASVEKMAIDALMKVLTSPDVAGDDFDAYFTDITTACSQSGVNVFGLLLRDEYRTRLFSSSANMSAVKLGRLADALATFVRANSVPSEELRTDHALGNLYAQLLYALHAVDPAANVGMMNRTFAAYATDYYYLQTIMGNFDVCLAQVAGPGSPDAKAAWDRCLGILASNHFQRSNEVISWLAVLGRYDLILTFYDLLSRNCGTVSEAAALMQQFTNGRGSDAAYAAQVQEPILARYYSSLASMDDRLLAQGQGGFPLNRSTGGEALDAIRQLFDYVRQNRQAVPFAADAVARISRSFDVAKSKPTQTQFVRDVLQYCQDTGVNALCGKAMIEWAAERTERLARRGDGVDPFALIAQLAPITGLDNLDSRELKGFMQRIAEPVVMAAMRSQDIATVCGFLALTEKTERAFLEECYDRALKLCKKQGRPEMVANLNVMCASVGSGASRSVAIGALSASKDPVCQDVLEATDRVIGGYGEDAKRSWELMRRDVTDAQGKRVFGRRR